MTLDPKTLTRLRFLSRVVGKETKHLASTDQHTCRQPFGIAGNNRATFPIITLNPFAINYGLKDELLTVVAVFDYRRNPASIVKCISSINYYE